MKQQIIFLEHHEIDKSRWDKAISATSNGLVYAMSWYLDLVSPQWHALVNSDYSLLMPLTWRKKYGIKYLFQPPFVQQLGLFAIDKIITPGIFKNFYNAIPVHFQYVDFYVNHKNNVDSVSAPHLRIKPRLTHHLSLNDSYEKTRSNYSENLKRNLKKAISNNLIAENLVSIEETIDLFQKNRGAAISGLGKNEYTLLKSIVKAASQRNMITALGVKKNNNLVASVFFIHSMHEYILLFSAVSEEGKKQGAISFLIDRFISSHTNEKMMLDFEGSMDKNLARFYKSFGASEIVYLHIQQNKLPKLLRWMKK